MLTGRGTTRTCSAACVARNSWDGTSGTQGSARRQSWATRTQAAPIPSAGRRLAPTLRRRARQTRCLHAHLPRCCTPHDAGWPALDAGSCALDPLWSRPLRLAIAAAAGMRAAAVLWRRSAVSRGPRSMRSALTRAARRT
eukprot:2956375-Prymnesium_polylepis.1